MGKHARPIPLNQEMPTSRKYIAHQHSKNCYHGIERDDPQNQSCDAEASADCKILVLRVIAQIVPPKLPTREGFVMKIP
jgi:hypothetical protein